MEKTIRTELWKMTGMIVALIGLGIYARDFVIAGLNAKLALNSSIFILAGCAAAIAFRHVLSLKNEVVAMKALQTDYGTRSRRPRDPLAKPAVVFDEPELLGQSYRLITEELGKQEDLKVSQGTVQSLLHEIDQRINDRKSTLIYFSGLMVFLGLLGAFIDEARRHPDGFCGFVVLAALYAAAQHMEGAAQRPRDGVAGVQHGRFARRDPRLRTARDVELQHVHEAQA